MVKNTKTTAIYLRSSKDRKDVSIDAQRRELKKLAADQGIIVTQEYSDVVESAKDENRPGFQRLLFDLKSQSRAWNTLLVVDTSRLSRRRYMAQVFKHEAKKRNIQILYSKLPESDPIADMVIVGVMEVFDELHSLMSKEKGLAGMAENVRQGYRAGGRAPKGYQLVKIPTGAMREGEAVTKSKLQPGKDAPVIARYLKMRAEGISRKRILQHLDLEIADTSAVGIE
jgi:site-specific DNA recombinase